MARALAREWIAVFGIPQYITSDRGSQFTSALWQSWSDSLGITLKRSTSYHPQTNGLVERFHRQFKDSLRARIKNNNWFDQLPWILMSIRATSRDDLGCAPVELTLGSHIALPGSFWRDEPCPPTEATSTCLKQRLSHLLPTPTATPNVPSYLPTTLQMATHVFIKQESNKSLTSSYAGPFKIIKRRSNHYVVDIAGQQNAIAIARLKPAFLPPGCPSALPPKKGRPPKQQ